MSKSSVRSDVSAGSALALAAEMVKALSPVLRTLSQAEVEALRRNPAKLQNAFRRLLGESSPPLCLATGETTFYMKNVRVDLQEKYMPEKHKLKDLAFEIKVRGDNATIEADKYGCNLNPVWAVTFDDSIGMYYPPGAFVEVDLIDQYDTDTVANFITAEYISKNGRLEFGYNRGDVEYFFVGLRIGKTYIEQRLGLEDEEALLENV
ncbi:MAG: hypothetical protein KGI79_02485 [Patescibacteria group bacterium]|nr:hypothetical protein [Patescibacteria group bacterium]MDE2116719.1 hypothetical protein [Patescibacteria group bacterium]